MYATKTLAALACVGAAAAFNPSMQMSTGRRAAIQGAGAAAVAAPLLRPSEANAFAGNMVADPYAPVITLFDARFGCERQGSEYTGAKAGTTDDEMCVKVRMEQIKAGNAAQVLADTISQLKPGFTGF